jgi:hypothetical protein
MLHLLTESQKNKVTKEYKMRLVIVVSWMIIFISLTGMALTLPIYLISVSKINHIKNDNQSKENSTKALRDQNFQDKIKQVNSSLGALKMFVGVPSPRNTYLKIVDSLPEGVYIDRYTYGLIDDSSASISISGVAPDRERLLELQNKLKSNSEFSGINIPITGFTKKKDLSFSLNFNLIRVIKK